MKEKLWAIFFAVMIAVGGYIMMSSAAKHTAIDDANLRQWRMDTAITRRSR